jgi:hypothetical protein
MVGVWRQKFETIRTSTDIRQRYRGFTGFDKERPVTGSTFGVDNVPTIKHEEPYPLTVASYNHQNRPELKCLVATTVAIAATVASTAV